MRRSPRVPNPGILLRMGSKIRLLAAGSDFGLSGSEGPYFRREAESSLPAGRDISDYREFVLGQDVSFAWHHLQLWAEFYEARFEVPNVGDADTFAYYVEAKYKFTPQLFGAVRWK